jgi:hypothetical protein
MSSLSKCHAECCCAECRGALCEELSSDEEKSLNPLFKAGDFITMQCKQFLEEQGVELVAPYQIAGKSDSESLHRSPNHSHEPQWRDNFCALNNNKINDSKKDSA